MSRALWSFTVLSITIIGVSLSPSATVADTRTETRSYPAAAGDALTVRNDLGRVRIRAWDSPEVRAHIDLISGGQTPEGLKVSSGRSGREISFHASFSGQPGESVALDILVPRQLAVTVSGSFLDIDVQGTEGAVSLTNISGSVTLTDITSPIRVVSGRSEISYHTRVQPRGDVHLDAGTGTIRCDLADGLNLRASLRSGGTIRWGDDPAVGGTTITKQVGAAGPLLEGISTRGEIDVRLGNRTAQAAPEPAPAALPPSGAPPMPEPAAAAPPPAPPEARNPEPPSLARPPAPEPPPSRPRQGVTPAPGPEHPASDAGDAAFKVAVNAVLLNVSVRERTTNRSIPGLRKDDFTVYEDGVRQDIQDLLPEQAPFSLMLLMDVSGSTREYVRLMREAAADFIGQINQQDRIAVATFNSGVHLVQDFTNDRQAAAHAINSITPGGGTAFYDALSACVDRYMRGIEGRKAIVVFTDGVDNQLYGERSQGSRTTFAELYRQVQEVDTIIYTIFLDSEGQYPGTSRLPRQAPGGRYPGGGYPGGGYPGGRYPGTSRLPLPIPLPVPVPSPSPSPGPSRRGQRGQDEAAAYDEARRELEMIAEQTGGRMYSPEGAGDLSRVYGEIAADLRIQYLLTYASSNTGRGGWRAVSVRLEGHPEAVVRTRKGYYARGQTG